MMELIIFTAFLGATILLLLYVRNLFSKQKEIVEPEPVQSFETEIKEEKVKKKAPERKVKEVKSTFKHQWLLTSLKGHSKKILDMDFSPNGKYLATTSEDETVIIWPVKEFPNKEHKMYRCNIEYDHSTFIKWSPDSKAFILQKSIQNRIQVYKMNKKTEGGFEFAPGLTFPSKHTTDIIGMDIASNGKFIATCSDKTDLIIWNLRGDVLARLDTYHNLTYCVKVSPCGRFVATSGFTADVRVWEVKFNKSGDFDKIVRAFELPGHRSGVYHFSFSPDSSRMATISKDGSWKVYDTNIEYTKGQDATIIRSGSFHGDSSQKSIVALSTDGQCVCVAQDKNVWFYSVITGELEGELVDVHTEPITRVLFEGSGKYILTTGDKHVRILHNVPGHRTNIQGLKVSLKKNLSNVSAKDRIEIMIKEAEDNLKQILGQVAE